MISPIALGFAQEAAKHPVIANVVVARARSASNIRYMAVRQTRAPACNCVFRYPSPRGWSDCVPLGSPVFSPLYSAPESHRQSYADQIGTTSQGLSIARFAAHLGDSVNLSRRGKTWANSHSQHLAGLRHSRLQPVVTRRQNRLSSAQAPVRPQPLPWTGALLPVPSSARAQTFSTANKTQKNATDLNASAALEQPDRETKTTGGFAAPVVFFVATARRPSGGPRTRRDMKCSTRF